MNIYRKMQYRFLVKIIIGSSLLGFVFAVLLYLFLKDADMERSLGTFVQMGVATGFFISLVVGIIDIFIFSQLKNPPLALTLFLQPLLYTFLIITIYGLVFYTIVGPEDFIRSSFLPQTLIFSLTMIFVVNFSQTMNRLLGQKAIVRLVLGLYHRPVSEKRFVMFLDLAGSTTIAEKLGDEAFHGFLRDFFRDITEPLLVKKAEIYKYVGDEVILTWKEEEGLADLNVLSVFFAIREHLRQFEDEYMRKYGTLPQFRAGLHFGKVIVGELGEYKMEVAILGDVMNTTARIEALCSEYDMNFILSRDVLDRFEGRDLAGYRLESIGSITLRGKEKDLELFGVEEV